MMVPRPAPSLPSVVTVRDGYAYASNDLAPRNFHEVGAGLSTEIRAGTPLWIGVDGLLVRNPASHYKTSLLLDSLAWAVQLRLPLEDEIGERPVGVAVDIGFGLPVPLSELVNFSEIQIYVGARGRFASTAQSVVETATRQVFELGFGGVSLDLVVANWLWIGLDGPRTMFRYDTWRNSTGWEPMYLSLSGGVAFNAF
jgi:hypothetical protein